MPASCPAWRDLLVVLRRMESRGEIRGGRALGEVAGAATRDTSTSRHNALSAVI